MIATVEIMERVCAKDENLQPDAGAREANVYAFIEWFNAVKKFEFMEESVMTVDQFDAESVLEMFHQDLKDYYMLISYDKSKT